MHRGVEMQPARLRVLRPGTSPSRSPFLPANRRGKPMTERRILKIGPRPPFETRGVCWVALHDTGDHIKLADDRLVTKESPRETNSGATDKRLTMACAWFVRYAACFSGQIS